MEPNLDEDKKTITEEEQQCCTQIILNPDNYLFIERDISFSLVIIEESNHKCKLLIPNILISKKERNLLISINNHKTVSFSSNQRVFNEFDMFYNKYKSFHLQKSSIKCMITDLYLIL